MIRNLERVATAVVAAAAITLALTAPASAHTGRDDRPGHHRCHKGHHGHHGHHRKPCKPRGIRVVRVCTINGCVITWRPVGR